MKVVILAGGLGTRISEESHLRPKPMIEIGGDPILWHIMKWYSRYGHNEFIICCGYKGYMIKEYFANYYLHRSDITFDFRNENKIEIHSNIAEPWKVTLVDTGLNTQTGGRIKRIKDYVDGETFMMTYGDGVSDVDINALIKDHEEKSKTATLTAIQPGGRFGVLEIDGENSITRFKEKMKEDGGWINGGFMVLGQEIFDYIPNMENAVFENETLEKLAEIGQINAFKHNGFWQCMDTQRDKYQLDQLVESGKAPWMWWNK